MALDPRDHWQEVVAHPSNVSIREHAKTLLPGIPPWLVGPSTVTDTDAPSLANTADSRRGTGGAVKPSMTTNVLPCGNMTSNSAADGPDRATLILSNPT